MMDDNYDVNNLDPLELYDAIGLSVMTPQRVEAHKLAAAIKKRWPSKVMIVGGPHAKHYTEQLIADPNFDYVVPLDGHVPIQQIMTGTATERVIKHVMSKQDIREEPRPDRSSENAIEIIRQYTYNLHGVPSTTMMTARGCPEKCTFCEDAMTAVKWTSYESIALQLDDMLALGFKGVYIFDDLFAIAKPKIIPICDMLSKREMVYRCNGQARYFTKWGDEMAKILGGSGCVEIAFGHETGSQKILDNIVKRTTVEQNYESIRLAKAEGIMVKSFILLGLPGETEETLADTEKFVANGGMDDFQCAVYMPYKGTQIRDAIDRGETIDLTILGQAPDGDITGAYGIKGGETSYEVRTGAISAERLEEFRNYLVDKYKPKAHEKKWQDKDEDMFFDTHKGAEMDPIPPMDMGGCGKQ